MANDLKFVDSVATSPTTILDLNTGIAGGVMLDEFSAPPPALRRGLSDALLSDGQRMSSSAYDNRAIRIALRLNGTADATALVIQQLGRVIDQPLTLLRWLPQGATLPVFYRVLRSPMNDVDESLQHKAQDTRRVEIELMAEPAAYGLPVDIASFVITLNPSTGANKMMVGPSILGTIKGDLDTPLMTAITAGEGFTTALTTGYLNSYALSGGFTHTLLARNLTELTSGTDTGAPVTGAGTNYIDADYKQCTFASPAMLTRLSGAFTTALTPMPGLYRILMRVVSTATSGSGTTVYQFRVGVQGPAGAVFAAPASLTVNTFSADGRLVDLGVIQIPGGTMLGGVGLQAAAGVVGAAPIWSIQAALVSNNGFVAPTIRFDELYLLPVDTNYGDATTAIITGSTTAGSSPVFDAVQDAERSILDTGTGPFTGTPTPLTLDRLGGLPMLRPGVNNYLTWIEEPSTITTTATSTFVGRYYPRYLYSRPAST
jgi:hypothetical protein